MAATMIIIPVLCNVGGATGFFTTDVMLLVLGVSSGFCQGTTYQMAAAFPPEYMSAVMFGNGLSGFGSNCLRAATLLIWPADKSEHNSFIGALALYMIAFLVLASCALAQACLRKNAYAQFYLKQTESQRSRTADDMSGGSVLLSNRADSANASNNV